jgi:hypothetical protein
MVISRVVQTFQLQEMDDAEDRLHTTPRLARDLGAPTIFSNFGRVQNFRIQV